MAYRLLIDDIDRSLMSSMSNWCVRLLINYLMIIHRLVIDYTSHTISSNFFVNLFPVIKFTFMFLDDNNSQIEIEFAWGNPIYCIHTDWLCLSQPEWKHGCCLIQPIWKAKRLFHVWVERFDQSQRTHQKQPCFR